MSGVSSRKPRKVEGTAHFSILLKEGHDTMFVQWFSKQGKRCKRRDLLEWVKG
jgi:hypothetical protein